jgi:hypothetical protein
MNYAKKTGRFFNFSHGFASISNTFFVADVAKLNLLAHMAFLFWIFFSFYIFLFHLLLPAPRDRKVAATAASLSPGALIHVLRMRPMRARTKTEHGRRNNPVARHEAMGVCRRSRAQPGGRGSGAQNIFSDCLSYTYSLV